VPKWWWPVVRQRTPSGGSIRCLETFCRLITDEVDQGRLRRHHARPARGDGGEEYDDGEGELLRRIRAIDAKDALCVAYDMHANV